VYKKLYVFILVFILGFASMGFGNSETDEKNLPWDLKLKSDLKYLVQSLEDIHPYIFIFTSEYPENGIE